MKLEAKIKNRIDKLDKQHEKFSVQERSSIDGIACILRMSELQWVLDDE